MKLTYKIKEYKLQFKEPAKTSRGVYKWRHVWLVELQEEAPPFRRGIGEAAPLPDLSPEFGPDYRMQLERALKETVKAAEEIQSDDSIPFDRLRWEPFPSICFAIESAILSIEKAAAFFDTPFERGEQGIPINGLIWMGDYSNMRKQLTEKIEQGFRCIKFKVGAINFDDELRLVRKLRASFSASDLQIRLDANGGFSNQDALKRLGSLSAYHIHSIEQPIRAKQYKEMRKLIQESPIPIALDEELIGIQRQEEKDVLLETLEPHYLVLKPSLHGGIMGTIDWIERCQRRGIGSWLTSALESNIGLEMIARLAASTHYFGKQKSDEDNSQVADSKHPNSFDMIPQGLGTGKLFVQNFISRLHLEGSLLYLR